MKHCSKAVMEKIIKYIFSGHVQCHDLNNLSLVQLLELAHISDMLLLTDLNIEVEAYIEIGVVEKSGRNIAFLPELISGLKVAHKYKLKDPKLRLCEELYFSLKDIPHIPEELRFLQNFSFQFDERNPPF